MVPSTGGCVPNAGSCNLVPLEKAWSIWAAADSRSDPSAFAPFRLFAFSLSVYAPCTAELLFSALLADCAFRIFNALCFFNSRQWFDSAGDHGKGRYLQTSFKCP